MAKHLENDPNSSFQPKKDMVKMGGAKPSCETAGSLGVWLFELRDRSGITSHVIKIQAMTRSSMPSHLLRFMLIVDGSWNHKKKLPKQVIPSQMICFQHFCTSFHGCQHPSWDICKSLTFANKNTQKKKLEHH